MTLSAVRESWQSLFEDSQIYEITPNFYFYDILDDSETDIAKYKHNQEINFFICLISKSYQYKAFGETLETYRVEIKYYKEDNKSGTNQNAIKDALETVVSRVRAVLGVTWLNSVDFYDIEQNQINLENITLAGEEVWLGRVFLNGIKSIC